MKKPRNKLSSRSVKLMGSEESEIKSDKDRKNEKPHFEALKAGDGVYYHFKSTAPLNICKLVGQVVGKALFEDIPLEPKFTNFILK